MYTHSFMEGPSARTGALAPCRPPKPGEAAGLARGKQPVGAIMSHAMPCATSTEGGARSSWTGSMSQQRDLSLNLSHCPRQTFTKRNVAKQRDSVPLRSSCTVAARIQVSESVPENFTCSCFRQAAISEEFALSSDAPRQLKSLQSWSQHVYRSTATSHCPLPEVLRCRSAQYMKGLAKPQTQ